MTNNGSNGSLEAALARLANAQADMNAQMVEFKNVMRQHSEEIAENTRQTGRVTEMIYSLQAEMRDTKQEIKTEMRDMKQEVKSDFTELKAITKQQAETANKQADSVSRLAAVVDRLIDGKN